MIQGTVGMFGVFAGLGIGITATKYVSQCRKSDRGRCGRLIGLCLASAVAGGAVGGMALILLGDWLAARTLAAPQLGPLLRLGAGMVVFGALQGAYLGVLAGFEAFKRIAWVNCMTSLLGTPIIVAATVPWGLAGAVLGTVLQNALGCAVSHRVMLAELAKADVPLSRAWVPGDWGVLWRFTLPAFLSSMAATPASWFSSMLLVNQKGGYSEMALVSAANQWLNLAMFVPYMMGGVLIPILTSLYAAGRQADFARLLRFNMLLNAGIVLVVALPLVLCSSSLLNFYGPGFRDGVPIFTLTMVAGLFISINNLLSRAMQSAGRAWIDLASNAVWAATVFAGSCLLVPRQRGLGSVAAHTIAALALALWQLLIIGRLSLWSEAGRNFRESDET